MNAQYENIICTTSEGNSSVTDQFTAQRAGDAELKWFPC